MYNEWRRYLDLTHVLYLYSVKIGSTAASVGVRVARWLPLQLRGAYSGIRYIHCNR